MNNEQLTIGKRAGHMETKKKKKEFQHKPIQKWAG